MKQRALTLAVLFAIAQSAAAGTLIVTKPTTEPSSSLSSSTNLNFDASAGSSADLTVNQGYTDVTSVGSVSMTTDGSLVLDTSDPADNSISFSGGSGAAPTGSGTLSLSGNTNTVEAAFSGNDPFSGSLDITASGQAGLFVGGNPQSTPVATDLSLPTLTMSTQDGAADIDVDSGSTLNIQKLDFEDTGANTASNSSNPYINITANSTGTDNTVNIGSVSVDGSAGTGNQVLTLDDFENNGTGTFNIGDLTAGGVQAYTSQDYSNINMVLNLQKATVGSGGFLVTNNSKSLVVNLGSTTNPGTITGSSPNAVFQLDNAVFNDYGGSIDMPSVVVAGDSQANLYGKSTITGNVSISGGYTGGTVTNEANADTNLSGNLDNNGVVSLDAGSTLDVSGDASFGGIAPSTPAILNISPNSAFSVGGNLYGDYARFVFNLDPAQVWGINVAGSYNIQNSTFVINATQGTYQNGKNYSLITTGKGDANVFSSNTFDYVYNGANSQTIDDLQPYVKSSSSGLDLCLGSACVATSQPAQPTQPTQPSQKPSQPTQPTQPTQPAQPKQPSQPAPAAPVFVPVKVHVISAPQAAAKDLVVSASQTQINAADDVSSNLLSTGIVGGGPRGLWAKGMGGTMRDGATHGYNEGLLVGYGVSLGDQHRDVLGGAFSYLHNQFGQDSTHYNTLNDYGFWLYGLYYPQSNRSIKLTATIGGGFSDGRMYTTSLGLPMTGDLDGNWFSADARASYWTHIGKVIISPRLSLGYTDSRVHGYTTTGGGFLDVHVGPEDESEFTVSPAVLIGRKYRLNGVRLLPQVRLGIDENIGPRPAAVLSAGQAVALANGLPVPHTQGTAELRLDIGHGPDAGDVRGWAGNVSVKRTFGGGESQTEAVATLKYNW